MLNSMVLTVRVKLLTTKVVILKVCIHKNEEMRSILVLLFTEDTRGNSGPVRSSHVVFGRSKI